MIHRYLHHVIGIDNMAATSRHDKMSTVVESLCKLSADDYLESAKKQFDQKLCGSIKSNAKSGDFEKCTTLGVGCFGRVMLAKKKSDDAFYAMKIVRKSHVRDSGQDRRLLIEKNISQALDFPFVMNVKFFFEDNVHMYMVMDFAPGGDLFHHLEKVGKLNEVQARFYAGQVVLALEYLHSLSIVYRDLKPENIVLDERGFIQLTDFGFAKIVRERTWTMCGTPGFLAPEIILNKGHNKAVDWWTFGILVFVMIAGYLPFQNSDQEKEYRLVVACKPKMPPHASIRTKKFLGKFIARDATKRLGNMKHGVDDVKQEAWFKDINWVRLYEKEVDPPFKPTKQYPGSTENFDAFHEEDFEEEPEDQFEKQFENF